VISLRRRAVRELANERILGSGDFVERILKEEDERVRQHYFTKARQRELKQIVEEACRRQNVSMTELRSGSRRGTISRFRAKVARSLVQEYGISMAEVARQVGVSTSAISKMLMRSNST